MSQDGFGTRTLAIDQENGESVEILTFVPALARSPEFAQAVGERVARLVRVRHAMYARARKVEEAAFGSLRLYSDYVPGWRLDRVLDTIEQEGWTLDISAIVTLLRQLIPAVALFSRHQREATIGTIGPERLLLTPQGRLVIAEYVIAPGLEKLQINRERLWREFRVAIPHGAPVSRIPPSADVVGIGVVAISLLLGRRLRDDEFLVSLGDLMEVLTETSAGSTRKLSDPLCAWLSGALQFETGTPYQSVQEAQIGFEETLAREKSYVSTAAQLDRFITRLTQVLGPPAVAGMHAQAAPARAESESDLPSDIAAAVDADLAARRQSSARHAVAVPTAPPPAPAAPPPPPAPLARQSSGRHVVAAPSVVPQSPSPRTTDSATRRAVAVRSDAPPSPAPKAGDSAARRAVAPPEMSAKDAVRALEAMTQPPAESSEPERADSPDTVPDGGVAGVKRLWRFAVPVLVALSLIQGGAIAWLLLGQGSARVNGGELSVQSRPAAARVSIDGEEKGVTPFQTSISPGSHVVEVRVGRSEPRVIPLVIREGVQTGLYVELQSVATVGGLEVRSEPLKARVTVAGQFRGETPLVVKDLPPGDVEVVVQGGNREIKQTVRIEPGITSQLVVPLGR